MHTSEIEIGHIQIEHAIQASGQLEEISLLRKSQMTSIAVESIAEKLGVVSTEHILVDIGKFAVKTVYVIIKAISTLISSIVRAIRKLFGGGKKKSDELEKEQDDLQKKMKSSNYEKWDNKVWEDADRVNRGETTWEEINANSEPNIKIVEGERIYREDKKTGTDLVAVESKSVNLEYVTLNFPGSIKGASMADVDNKVKDTKHNAVVLHSAIHNTIESMYKFTKSFHMAYDALARDLKPLMGLDRESLEGAVRNHGSVARVADTKNGFLDSLDSIYNDIEKITKVTRDREADSNTSLVYIYMERSGVDPSKKLFIEQGSSITDFKIAMTAQKPLKVPIGSLYVPEAISDDVKNVNADHNAIPGMLEELKKDIEKANKANVNSLKHVGITKGYKLDKTEVGSVYVFNVMSNLVRSYTKSVSDVMKIVTELSTASEKNSREYIAVRSAIYKAVEHKIGELA